MREPMAFAKFCRDNALSPDSAESLLSAQEAFAASLGGKEKASVREPQDYVSIRLTPEVLDTLHVIAGDTASVARALTAVDGLDAPEGTQYLCIPRKMWDQRGSAETVSSVTRGPKGPRAKDSAES